MKKVAIDKIWIDEHCRLCVFPADLTISLGQVFRSATGVRWDEELRAVCSPAPRTWTYADWFAQIVLDARSEYGIELFIHESTRWSNVQDRQRASITEAQARLSPRDQEPIPDVESARFSGDIHRRLAARELFKQKRWREVVTVLEDVRYPEFLEPSELRRLQVARSRSETPPEQ